ncbi:TIGR00266 family protein [Winogradskyella sp.]|uniref:TIGR00266 family protein n=1 Tax=Winogradskyella sp. TaxID=1883156 RepID=UPI0035112B20
MSTLKRKDIMEKLPDFTDRNAHEIDYRIYGEEMQYVEIELDPQEAVIAESGSFMMMDDGIKMDTIFGDGSQKDKGFLGKILGAGKRILTGESLFMTAFYNDLTGKRNVSFASPYPGKIIPIDLNEYRGKFICQKDAFLCAAKGVSVGIEFSKKLGRGLFGGEGFIMQKLEGDGMAFVHAGGTTAVKTLAAGETLRVDTGCIIGFTKDIDYDIEFVGGIKNSIFGGEGLFFAKLRGPGKVYIQSLPFSRLAGRILASVPRGGKSKGEGSILGGLGDLLDGDNRF